MSRPNPAPAVAGIFQAAALAILLAVLVARPFVPELPMRTQEFSLSHDGTKVLLQQPIELVRLTFSLLLVAAAALYAIGAALSPSARLRGWVFLVLLTLFSLWSFRCCAGAADRRTALDAWLDQTAILLAAWTAMQLALHSPWRSVLLAALVALAGGMGCKAIAQVTSEIPDRVAMFRAEQAKQLAEAGIEPDTPQARMFEKRLADPSALGYQGLANVFTSLLIVPALAALGLGIDRLRQARRDGREPPGEPLPPGQVNLPLLAGVLTLLAAAAALAAIVLTRSKGGIMAAGVAIAIALVLGLRQALFQRHRRKLMLAALAVLLAGCGAATLWGLARGGLPGRSLQVRWEYWQGAAGLIRDHWRYGVGPDNFGNAYLPYRLAVSAESPKSAHNLFIDAASAYGLPGAALFLILIGYLVWKASAVPADPVGLPSPALTTRQKVRWAGVAAVAVLLIRFLWMGSLDESVIFIEAVLPAGVFAAGFALGLWLLDTVGVRWANVAILAAMIGFVLHNLVEYTLWTPAAATLFWVAGATVAGQFLPEPAPARPRRRGALAVAAALAIFAAGSARAIWRPVYERTCRVRQAAAAWDKGARTAAQRDLAEAVSADRLDGYAPAALASVEAALGQGDEALVSAKQSFDRSPSPNHATMLMRLLWQLDARIPALQVAAQAVDLDPMDVRLHLEYATMLAQTGQADQVAQQVQIIRQIDQARPADSDLRLTPKELAELDALGRGQP